MGVVRMCGRCASIPLSPTSLTSKRWGRGAHGPQLSMIFVTDCSRRSDRSGRRLVNSSGITHLAQDPFLCACKLIHGLISGGGSALKMFRVMRLSLC
jgi:hypothetical protein